VGDFVEAIQNAYATQARRSSSGRACTTARSSTTPKVRVPLAMTNRHRLEYRRHGEEGEAEGDCAQTGARRDDLRVDEPVRMRVTVRAHAALTMP
jgi:hypothetical protein